MAANGNFKNSAVTVSSGIAYIDYNGFYYFRRPFRCRAASVTVLVEIGLQGYAGTLWFYSRLTLALTSMSSTPIYIHV